MHNISRIRCQLLLTLWITFGFLLTEPAGAQRNRLRDVIDQTMKQEMQKQKIVGAAVGMIINGKIVHSQGYGMADLESKTEFTADTVINWASNSKPVVAVLAMQLLQRKKLDLDATIDNYLPELPKHFHEITPRHLLCHQSGIPHYSNGKIVAGEKTTSAENFDPQKAINRFINSPLIFKPGSRDEYSSYAYVLLSAVVQAAGNEPIADQIKNRITLPLGMQSFQLDVPFENQLNWSKAYRLKNNQFVEVADYANYWKHGAGGYKSNVQDFAKFANSLMKTRLMNRPTTVQMMTAQQTSSGKSTDRGLGVFVSGSGKSLKISHGGSQSETKTRMAIYPNRNHGIVVMCNCPHADPGKITSAVYAALKKNGIRF